MCGIVGMVGTSAVNQRLYDALTVLQHRGQDAAGIATSSGDGELCVRKGPGLVRDVFQQHHMLELKGNVGIGHVRSPTAGCDGASEAQPFYVNAPYGICLGHNGNLTNSSELAEILIREDRRHLNTTSDSEVLLNVFASELQRVGAARITPADVFAALSALYRRCRGGYAVGAMMIGHGILGFRAPSCATWRQGRRYSSTSRAACTPSSASSPRCTRRASSSTCILRAPTRRSTTSRSIARACAWAIASPTRSCASTRGTTSTWLSPSPTPAAPARCSSRSAWA